MPKTSKHTISKFKSDYFLGNSLNINKLYFNKKKDVSLIKNRKTSFDKNLLNHSSGNPTVFKSITAPCSERLFFN